MILPRIILPWARTSDLSGNGRLHWGRKAKLVKAQRQTADALARAAGWHKIAIADGATVAMTMTYCPPSVGGVPDDDNVISANKGHRDGLARALGVDDQRMTCRAVRGERCKGGAVIVDAEIAEPSTFRSIGDLAAQAVDRAVASKRAAE